MPSGIIHEEYRTAFSPVVFATTTVITIVATIIVKNPVPFIAGMSLLIHYGLTKYIGPDLDQMGRTKSETYLLEDFGPVIGKIIMLWWTLYAVLMHLIAITFGFAHPRYGAHRTWLTHKVFPGTFIRMIWFNLPIIVFWYLFFDYPVAWTVYIISILLGQAGAFIIGDYIHIWLDNNYPKESNNAPTRTVSSTRRNR